MVDFEKIGPDWRARMFAGLYLQTFAIMEDELNGLIKSGLKLGEYEAIAVVKNVQFRDKIHIAKTMVRMRFAPGDKREAHCTFLENVRDSSQDRNIVAHELFGAAEDGDGIEFLVTRARGKISFPKVVWSEAAVLEKCKTLKAHIEQLKALRADCEKIGVTEFVDQFLTPSEYNSEPTLEGRLDLLLRAIQSSGNRPSSRQKDE